MDGGGSFWGLYRLCRVGHSNLTLNASVLSSMGRNFGERKGLKEELPGTENQHLIYP